MAAMETRLGPPAAGPLEIFQVLQRHYPCRGKTEATSYPALAADSSSPLHLFTRLLLGRSMVRWASASSLELTVGLG